MTRVYSAEDWFDVGLPDDATRVYWVGDAPPPESTWLRRMKSKHRRRRNKEKRGKP